MADQVNEDYFSDQNDIEQHLFNDNQDHATTLINTNVQKIKDQIIQNDELIRTAKDKEVQNTLLLEENIKLKDDFVSYRTEYRSKKDELQYSKLIEELRQLQNKCITLTEANKQFEGLLREQENKKSDTEQFKKVNSALKANIKSYDECVNRQKQLVTDLETVNEELTREVII